MLQCEIRDYYINTAVFVSTRYSAIFFLSHLDLGSKIIFYMLVGSITALFSCQSLDGALLKTRLFQKANKCNWVRSISGLLRDPSEDDLEKNRQKRFNANSRAGDLSMTKCMQKYVLTQQTLVSRDACPALALATGVLFGNLVVF